MSERKAPGRAGWAAIVAAMIAAVAVAWYLLVPMAGGDRVGQGLEATVRTTPPGSVSDETGEPSSEPLAVDEAPTTEPQAADTGAPDPAEPPDSPETENENDVGPEMPTFDVVRVAPDGNALVAGHAAAGSKVSVVIDGEVVGGATAGVDGAFAALFDVAPSGDARVVALVAEDIGGGTVRSEDTVILTPARTTEPDGDAVTAVGSTVRAEGDAAQPAASGEGATGAPGVLLARDDGVELLQPAGAGGATSDRVVIDLISYGDGGSVILEGRSAGHGPGELRVYLDNAAVLAVEVTSSGNWRSDLPAITPGLYTLRVDQVDSGGKVVSRFETPFKRENPAELAALVPDGASGDLLASVITVQPGYSLWGIASDRYGDGLRYVQIFEANRTQIRDPDLIYPGQVFELPDSESAPAE